MLPLELIFPGTGATADRMRAFDWSTMELGAPGNWPATLRIALGVCLGSGVPMQIWWGPSMTLFYNDACLPFLAAAGSPLPLGRSAREAWPEVWELVGSIVESVAASGIARNAEAVPIIFAGDPAGKRAVSFFFSPILGNDGAVEGVFCTLADGAGKAPDGFAHGATEQAVRNRPEAPIIADDTLRWEADELRRAQAALRDSEARLAVELADLNQLQDISTKLIQENDIDSLYAHILDAAMAVMHADKGSMQMYDPRSGELLLLTSKGLHPASASCWKTITPESGTSCAAALRMGRRVVVPDAELAAAEIDPEKLVPVRLSGIKSSQSTPLVSRGGRFVGMLSTHWRTLHEPSERELRLLDVLARQAADLVERTAAEAALRESEARYRALITAGSQVLYRMSPDWSEVREVHGGGFVADAKEANPNWLQEYIPEDEQERVLAAIEAAIRAGSVFELEHRVRCARGGQGWTFSRAVPLRNAAGEIVEWFGAARNITARKQAQGELAALRQHLEALVAQRTAALAASEERFRALVTASAQIVWTTDAAGWVVDDSPSWREFTGQTTAQLLGEGWKDAIHPEDRTFVGKAWSRAVATHTPLRTELRVWHAASGAWRWTAVRGVPLCDEAGAVHGWVGMNVDIEERKRAEEQLRRMASELTMVEQGERRRISQILHDDLQQQLYMVRMQMTQLMREAEDADTERLRAHLKALYTQIGEAITVTRRLSVDLSPPVIEGEGLAEALGWLASQMEQMHGLSVEVDAPDPCVIKDANMRVLLFQVARELLFNVVKHAGTNRARAELRQDDGALVMRVIDQGRGFDMEEATGRARRGLGLFSASDRLGLFGGTIEIDSRPGGGTRVAVRLPLAKAGRRRATERERQFQ